MSEKSPKRKKPMRQEPYSRRDQKLLLDLIDQYDTEKILSSAKRDSETITKKGEIWSLIVPAFNASAGRQAPSTRDSLSRLIGNMKSRESRSASETFNATDELSVDFVPEYTLSSHKVEDFNFMDTDSESASENGGKIPPGMMVGERIEGTFVVKSGLAQMCKGGIIMDVVNAEQARVAEEAGACAVMALERVPADIRKEGGVARMSDPKLIREIMDAVTIPVFAKVRIGHFAEAQILEAVGVDMIDESEVLTPADDENHIDKRNFKVPFVCGARNLGEALRRISEGAAMIRTKGEAGTGNVVNAVHHARAINREIRMAQAMSDAELFSYARQLAVPIDLLRETAKLGRLPVVNFAAGGLATPADVSMLMQLGVDGCFVGSGIFKSSNPKKRAHAMVQAVTHYKDPEILAKVSEDLGEPMVGINCSEIYEKWENRESEMAKK